MKILKSLRKAGRFCAGYHTLYFTRKELKQIQYLSIGMDKVLFDKIENFLIKEEKNKP